MDTTKRSFFLWNSNSRAKKAAILNIGRTARRETSSFGAAMKDIASLFA